MRRRSEAKHCSSLCSQSEGDEYCGDQTRTGNSTKTCSRALVMFATCSWPSLCEQSELQCWRRNRRLYNAKLHCKGVCQYLTFYLEPPKVMRRPSILLLFSERGTRHDRTLDETRANVGRRSPSKIGNGLSATVFSSPHKDFPAQKSKNGKKTGHKISLCGDKCTNGC